MPFASLETQFPVGRIAVVAEHGTAILRLTGDIDAAAVAMYEDGERPAAAPSPVISVVDLAEVTFLSSSGVGFLLRQTKGARDRGCLPLLRGVPGRARRVLHMTGVDGLFRADG
jgi:anti-anti-sigma factor